MAAGIDVNRQDLHGDTPLHIAVAQGRTKVVEVIVDSGRVNFALRNGSGKLVLEMDISAKLRKTVYEKAPFLRTFLFTHTDCLEHRTRDGHQECVQRLETILAKVHDSKLKAYEYQMVTDFAPATDKELSLVHDKVLAGWLGGGEATDLRLGVR